PADLGRLRRGALGGRREKPGRRAGRGVRRAHPRGQDGAHDGSHAGVTTDAPARRPRGRPGHDRAAVLRTAIDLFIRRGYDATSVSDLAAELGVTKSAVYHHFASKEALLAAALDEALSELGAAVEAAATATDGEP